MRAGCDVKPDSGTFEWVRCTVPFSSQVEERPTRALLGPEGPAQPPSSNNKEDCPDEGPGPTSNCAPARAYVATGPSGHRHRARASGPGRSRRARGIRDEAEAHLWKWAARRNINLANTLGRLKLRQRHAEPIPRARPYTKLDRDSSRYRRVDRAAYGKTSSEDTGRRETWSRVGQRQVGHRVAEKGGIAPTYELATGVIIRSRSAERAP